MVYDSDSARSSVMVIRPKWSRSCGVHLSGQTESEVSAAEVLAPEGKTRWALCLRLGFLLVWP